MSNWLGETRDGSGSRLSLVGALVTFVALVTAVVPACFFDQSGLRPPARDGALSDVATSDGAQPDGSSLQDGALLDAELPDANLPPCTNGTFECLPSGSARLCENGHWVMLGPCPLGCDAFMRLCRVPSNVPADLVDEGDDSLELELSHSPVHIDTDTGRIYTPSGPEHRPGVPGLDPGSGIFYGQLPQSGLPGIGVLVLTELTVKAGVDVIIEGSRALAIVAEGSVWIGGSVYLNSVSAAPGPGGLPGGAPGQVGSGACGGLMGAGTSTGHGCSSGGGGGGHGGSGGSGGDAWCDFHLGGLGGGLGCSNPSLVPLVGGAGGAGGAPYISNPTSAPGEGGGGGGALQISALTTIEILATGRIHAGGGPGAGGSWAGGTGGGAGGGLLLESIVVTVASGSVLAANGGGGGGGDCS